MKFQLEFHQKILHILKSLNAGFFVDIGACFGGGTLLALHYGEYRLSKDMDFICPIGPGYRQLRQDIAESGYNALFKSVQGFHLPQDIRADQYGVRFAAVVDDTVIKFEIIAEARIILEKPVFPDWCSIPCLAYVDCCAEKLLANADRWGDEALGSKDLIDLAVLRFQSVIPSLAYEKANAAYPVIASLTKALTKIQRKADYRDQCFTRLQVNNRVTVVDGFDLLAADFGLEATQRRYEEIMLR